MLTIEEKADLEYQCAEARVRCKEAWQVIIQLRKFHRDYMEFHTLWRRRFEEADRKLAKAERLEVIAIGRMKRRKSKDLLKNLSKKDLLELLETLKVEEE